ncbi:MAG: TPM domain-containing protein, partial [Pseudomonadota bacterium]
MKKILQKQGRYGLLLWPAKKQCRGISCREIIMPFRRCLKLLLPCLAGLLFLQAANAADAKKTFPRPVGAVNDFARILPPDIAAAMESLAQEVLEKTGTSIVVATFKSIAGNDPDLYANELYADWGIGKKGTDKGVLIFLALEERKVRIETGYGVEGILPDGLAGSILDHDVIPLCKQGKYDKGLFNAMLAVGQV